MTRKLDLLKDIEEQVAGNLMKKAEAADHLFPGSMSALIRLSRMFSAFVHEMQKERGLTAGYYGSGGEKFGPELKLQKIEVDRLLPDLKEAARAIPSGAARASYARDLAGIVSELEDLERTRTRAAAMKIPAAKAIDWYTQKNTRLLDVVGTIAISSIPDPSVATGLIAYQNLLQAKERAGLERAVLTRTFASDYFSGGSLRRFYSLVSRQETYLKVFLSLAGREDLRLYEEKMKNPVIADVERMRARAVDVGSVKVEGFGIDATAWFKAITRKINLMREVEIHLSEDLLLKAGTLRNEARKVFIAVGLLTLIASFTICAIGFMVASGITKPIIRTTMMLRDISEGEGDLTARLPASTRDEIGQMATWFNLFIEKIAGIMGNIAGNTGTLTAATGDLGKMALELDEKSGDVTARSNNVATASEETSSNMNSASAAMEEAADNMGMVSGAMDDMSETVREIARNSEQARSLTERAVNESQSASESVGELGSAASDIGNVTETITEISEQTNLLALNATIEAARAGDAGKGFAVVAEEIKHLAGQTAAATTAIREKIEGIQSSTNLTVKRIDEISAVIEDVNSIVSTIATAVEEQAVTTGEIAGNVAQASRGIREVTEKVTQSTAVSESISREINAVSDVADDLGTSSENVNLNVQQLNKLAAGLNELVGMFKI